MTCGTPCRSFDTCPAKFAYHVCECTRSASPVAAAIERSVDIVSSAAFAPTLEQGRVRQVRDDAGLVARVAEAVHIDVDQPAKFAGQVLDVNAGAAVHVRRVLAGEEGDTHDGNPSRTR